MEKDLQSKIIKRLKEENFEAFKVGYNGYPDLGVLDRARQPTGFFWIEVKTEEKGSQLRISQKSRIRNLKKKGDSVYVVRNLDELSAIINFQKIFRTDPISL